VVIRAWLGYYWSLRVVIEFRSRRLARQRRNPHPPPEEAE